MNAPEGRQISFPIHGTGTTLLTNVNVYVRRGECVMLRGPSGVGKSTLCHILAGIIPRSISGQVSGEVFFFGENLRFLSLARVAETVGVLFQNPDSQLFFPTVEDELAFGPENLCLPRPEMDKRINEALAMVHMEEYRLVETETLSLEKGSALR